MFTDIPLFNCLTKEEIAMISSHAKVKSYKRHQSIIAKGDQTDSLYLVLKGRLKVFISDKEGKEVILAFLEAGDYFGELALLDREPRSASVATTQESKLAHISRKDFEKVLKTNNQIALNLLATLARRNRLLASNVGNLALLDVYGRVAKAILSQAKEEDGLLITNKITHQEIANLAGSSREMVSKIIKELKIGRYIAIKEKRIIIQNQLPARW